MKVECELSDRAKERIGIHKAPKGTKGTSEHYHHGEHCDVSGLDVALKVAQSFHLGSLGSSGSLRYVENI
jgi:hypothetical protein